MCYAEWYDDVITKSMFLRNYDEHSNVVLSTQIFFIAVYIVVDNVTTESKFIKTLCFSYSVVDFFMLSMTVVSGMIMQFKIIFKVHNEIYALLFMTLVL